MDEHARRMALQRYLEAPGEAIADAIYHDDAVLEFPQSRERFEGKASFMAWRKIYPAEVEFRIRRIHSQGNLVIVETRVRYDGGPWGYGCSIHEWRGDKIARETIYYGDGWEAPAWRAAWRAAWQDEDVH